jgi:hypothetical protein
MKAAIFKELIVVNEITINRHGVGTRVTEIQARLNSLKKFKKIIKETTGVELIEYVKFN